MVDRNSEIPVTKQCKWLGIKRGKVYYVRQISTKKQELLDRVDELYTDDPTRGQRRMIYALRNVYGLGTGRDAIRWAMNVLNIEAVCPKKKLSAPNLQHKKYPYLLRNVHIGRVNQVWSTDITYIRLKGGFVYLTAIVDWHSRFILAWRLSTTLDSRFCIEALQEALDKYGNPEISNTDQGSQFTSLNSPASLSPTESRSAWMEKAALWITSSLNVSGGPSSMTMSTSKDMRRFPNAGAG